MLVTPNFEEQFPDTFKESFFRGRRWQNTIAKMRTDGSSNRSITVEQIYADNPKLLDWWEQEE
jgi:hypothetical protein